MTKLNKAYFILYACCVPVKGHMRSVIMDVQRAKYIFIPNSLYELTKIFRNKTITEILLSYPTLTKDIFDEYIDYLLEHEMGFYTENPSEFPPINETVYSPYLLQDCILELSSVNLLQTDKIIRNLAQTGCQNIELRSYDYFPIQEIFSFVEKLRLTRVRNVEIYNAFHTNLNIELLETYLMDYQIVGQFYIHSAQKDYKHPDIKSLIFTKHKISSSDCCGHISPKYFAVNLPFYLESKQKNNCLNRKITISEKGVLKNCPSLKSEFGNIAETDFCDVIDLANFKRLWSVNKDQIDTCKDCEFRYMCSDCRAFIDGENEKPLKCKYNPYTATYE